MDQDTARSALLKMGVHVQLLDAIAGSKLPFQNMSWSMPDFVAAEELEGLVPNLQGMVPIADQNGEAIIAVLPESLAFIRYYYEDGMEGNSAIDILGHGYRQFAAKILIESEEAGLREQLIEAAAFFRFDELPQLLAVLDADPYLDEAVDRFVADLALHS